MTLARDSTGYHRIRLAGGDTAWLDDHPNTNRIIVQRAPNRFQAYELLEGEFLSVGWLYARDDIRLFLKGHGVTVCTELDVADPPTFQHPALITF